MANQIVVQLTTAPMVRALVQSGDQFQPDQVEIHYDDLTAGEKVIWDDFVAMLEAK